MPITPEQTQDINNLQARMLQNIAKGGRSWDGLTEEEITRALSFFRQNRSAAGAAGGKAKAKATKEKAAKVALDPAQMSEKAKRYAALLDDE